MSWKPSTRRDPTARCKLTFAGTRTVTAGPATARKPSWRLDDTDALGRTPLSSTSPASSADAMLLLQRAGDADVRSDVERLAAKRRIDLRGPQHILRGGRATGDRRERAPQRLTSLSERRVDDSENVAARNVAGRRITPGKGNQRGVDVRDRPEHVAG